MAATARPRESAVHFGSTQSAKKVRVRVGAARYRLKYNAQNPDRNYSHGYTGARVTLAFLRFSDVKAEDEFTGWERFNQGCGGPVAHVEIWFPQDTHDMVACSAVSRRGVFFMARKFASPKKPYTFYDLAMSEKEQDELFIFLYEQDGKPFNWSGMMSSWLYEWFTRATDEQQWFCSELIFAGLSHIGLFERIAGGEPEFVAFTRTNPGAITPTCLYERMLGANMLKQTFHQHLGIYGYGYNHSQQPRTQSPTRAYLLRDSTTTATTTTTTTAATTGTLVTVTGAQGVRTDDRPERKRRERIFKKLRPTTQPTLAAQRPKIENT
jgi:hypothetical protein